MRFLRQAGAVFALMLVASSVAAAQRAQASTARLWELGVDAALSFGLDDPNVTLLQIPVANFRAGVHTSDVLSIEPFGSITFLRVEGIDDAFTDYTFGVGALYHFSRVRTASQTYVRPFLALQGGSAGGVSDSDIGVGVGFGMKWPRLNGRMAWRGEANLFAIDNQTTLSALFGLSFYTR